MDREDASVSPVADVERLLILRRELRTVAENDGRGRREADVHHAGQRVGIPRGPAPGAVPPAVVRAGHDVQHAVGHIPRAAHVPLHVGIEGEEVAVLVEGDIERVAQAAGPELHLAAVGLHAQDVAGGQQHIAVEHARVPRAGDEAVVREVPQRRVGGQVLGQVDVVAVRNPQPAVRPELQVIAPVADAALGLEKLGGLVEMADALGVAQADEGLRVVRVRVERAVGVEQAAAFEQRVVDDFDLRDADGIE